METSALHLNMLVVDDDDLDRERVRRFLARGPLEVELTEAASGAEALRLVRTRVFDCVVLDNQLGDTDGAALLSQLHREARQDFPIIFITGAGNESLAVHVMQDGAADYLAKASLNADALVRSIRRSVETHRLQCENDRLREQLESRVEEQAATIRRRERDLRTLVDNAPYLIGCWDAERRCRFGNRTHADWFGVEADRLAGLPLHELLGPKLMAAFEQPVRDALAGQAAAFECTVAAVPGQEPRHAQAQLVPDLDEAARVQGFFLSISDIGPQKSAQARIEELLAFSDAVIEHSPIGIAVFGPDGGCVRANAGFLDLFGEPFDTLRHLDCRQRAAWRACGLAQAAAATLSTALAQRAEYTLPLPGREPAELDCAMARVDRGGVPHLLLIARDIGEQRRSHAVLVQARDVAQSAARTKSTFLANMSHEIRTPMNAIVGLSRLALESDVPTLTQTYVEKVHHASMALMGVLDDVLDYSKLEAGHLRVERAVVDLEDVLQRVADLFEARLEQQDLSLTIELEPGVARHVWGDALRLSQILNNLVGNAIKFTPAGGIRVRVSCGPAPAGHAALRFEVEDSGIGIAPEVRARLFDAFVQADDSITRRFGGTGLGLAICRALVELMGGRIGVDSTPGKGSFWFSLTPEIAPAPRPAGAETALANAVIAVVDDDHGRRESVLGHVLAWGAKGVGAARLDDLAPGWSQRAGGPPSLPVVVWDLSGEQGDVAPALSRLRQATPGLRLVLVANAAERSRLGTIAAHESVHEVLHRPMLASRLYDSLAGLVARESARVEPGRASPGRTAATPREQIREMARPLHGMRLLLVEDNPLNRIVATELLKAAGLEVSVATDGVEGVRRFAESPPGEFGAILMDLHMPGLDGLDATRRIRELPHGRDVPIIAMTAAAMPEDRARCLAAGMTDHLSKPVLPEQCIRVLLRVRGDHQPAFGPTASETSAVRSNRAGARLPVPAAEPALPNRGSGVDLERLVTMLGGNRTLAARLLAEFADRESDAATRLRGLLDRGERDAAKAKAHDLKGCAGSIGALDTSAAAGALQRALDQKEDAGEELTRLASALRADLADIAATLAREG